jgi:hypothetical protein
MNALVVILIVSGTVGVLGGTSWVLYRGSRDVGVSPGRAAMLAASAGVVLGAWGLASALIAHRGGYAAQAGKQPPWLAIAAGSELVALLALSRLPVVRRALSGPNAGRLLARPHATRVVGLAFILSMAAGHLPALFALPAGLGDMAVGTTELFVWRRFSARGRLITAFNWLGIGDLVVAMTLGGLTGYDIIHVSPSSAAIAQLPVSLIPTVGVPVFLALHILGLGRLRSAGGSATDGTSQHAHGVDPRPEPLRV